MQHGDDRCKTFLPHHTTSFPWTLQRSHWLSFSTAMRTLLLEEKQRNNRWASACDFQQCGILISVDSGEPVQPPVKLRNSKWCSVSSLTIIEYSSDKQRLWSDCAYAQAGLRLCLSHIPNCWKSHALAQMSYFWNFSIVYTCRICVFSLIKHTCQVI